MQMPISPKRGRPDGHLALECAQPDKKANSWYLVRPGQIPGFIAELPGQCLCGLHVQGLAGPDVHNLPAG